MTKKVVKEEIVQEVKKQINLKNIKFLLWYGTWPGRDIDLLIVLKKTSKVRLCESSKSKLDILMIDNKEFMRRLNLLDPAITDPLITGFVLLGDRQDIGLLRSDTILSLSCSEKKPLPIPEETIQFLRKKACERLQNADTLLQKKNKSFLYPFLIELSWACGYYAFAEYYNNTSIWITFDHLLVIDEHIVFEEVMKALEVVKSGKEINNPQIISLFQKTQKMLGVA